MGQQLTLQTLSRSTALVMRGTKVVGHIGLAAGSSCAYVNASKTFGLKFAFVAHTNTCEGGLRELVKLLTKDGLL